MIPSTGVLLSWRFQDPWPGVHDARPAPWSASKGCSFPAASHAPSGAAASTAGKATARGDAKAASAGRLQALALRAIQAGALAGGPLPDGPPEVLATRLASLAEEGQRWWSTFPAKQP